MTSALYWTEAFVIWALTVQTVRHLTVRRHSPAASASLAHVMAFALGALVQSPDIRPRLDLLTGIHGLGRWLAFSLFLGSTAAFWLMIAYVTRRRDSHPPRVRTRLLWAAGAITVMGVLLLGSGSRDDAGASFLAVYGRNLMVAGFYLTFLSYIVTVLVDTLRLAWRYKKYARQRYLRVGMHLLVAGDFCGLAYSLYLGATVVTSYLSLPLPPGATTYATTYLGFGAVVLILAGPTISVWGPRLAAPWRAAAQRRALRRLHPLWLALTTAMPYLRRQPTHTLGDAVGYRLYRRVIEIRDGLLILEPYRDLHLEQQPTAGATIHARSVVSALRAFSASESDEGDGTATPSWGDRLEADRGTDDHNGKMIAPTMPLMRDEVAYLTQLSRAFARLHKGS
ncbi:MAB_1171c family putative transporter [Streptosporangium sp. NPDC000396]|uniref:MAB_1171c family putative transporter n=1 Tax=Streptosporangium sp. NPDC000396 TaxID=3366185 RepID=UPI003694E00B